ncbi:MAG: hypothetical protein Kow0042_16760 [Calditrichia bacterium]
MPNKTERILGYLPGTFKYLPRPTAVYSVVDAFGGELLQGENSLAAVMSAHWVDHADRNAEIIDDLARIAALYGLAPRPDETVEEFREHLKRYIRTFLEGTITIQGIFRVVAEIFGLEILDDYDDMDLWWKRSSPLQVIPSYPGNNAAGLLLGVDSAHTAGSGETAARVTATVELKQPINLLPNRFLQIQLDDQPPLDVDVTATAANPAAVTLEEILQAINAAFPQPIAFEERYKVQLISPTLGPGSRLEIHDRENDAAENVLGLPPRTYRGSDPTAARVTGSVELADNIDLSEDRFLRLAVDNTYVAEFDCAGANPAQTTIEEIKTAINSALGIELASHDGHFLTLTSPTVGAGSSIVFQKPAAQDATEKIFGPVNTVYSGHDALAARMTGRRNLSQGVDLSENYKIQLRINDSASTTINCAGANPQNTRIEEIVTAINAAFGAPLATHNVRFITLTTPEKGAEAEIVFETPPDHDATEVIFGLLPRAYQGADAFAARLRGKTDLSGGVNLWGKHLLTIGLDGNTPVTFDLWKYLPNPQVATLDEITTAINQAVGEDIAHHDTQHLILASPTIGADSRLIIGRIEELKEKAYLSRAFVSQEAALSIFGFIRKEAYGSSPTRAVVKGQKDLSRGIDLSQDRYLRLVVDNQPGVDIDCAGKRPRATLVQEVVERINQAVSTEIAETDGKILTLRSPAPGEASRLIFQDPRPFDALEILLGIPPQEQFGKAASGVHFIGLVDLSSGITLPNQAAIKLGVDGKDPIQINLSNGGPEPETYSLGRLVITINVAMGVNIASHDGTYLHLASPTTGSSAGIEFAVPGGVDVTALLFGIDPPRSYHGKDALPAQIKGRVNLSSGVDLSQRKFLRISLDGQSAISVDCSAHAANPGQTTLEEIVQAVNEALGGAVAGHDGAFLILNSINSGVSAKIQLSYHVSGNAREKLLGAVPEATIGQDATPAVITGVVDLLQPVNLSQRRKLRLVVNGNYPLDIDVAGVAPGVTFLDEIIAAINAAFPGLASATEDDKLKLTSPTSGPESYLAVLPLRVLEILEYPPHPQQMSMSSLSHGSKFYIDNLGVAPVSADMELFTSTGVAGVQLINLTSGWRMRVEAILYSGYTLRIRKEVSDRLQVVIQDRDGNQHPVGGEHIQVGPIGSQIRVPYNGMRRLTQSTAFSSTLQLNNPLGPNIVELRARTDLADPHQIVVGVQASPVTGKVEPTLPQANEPVRLKGRLQIEGKKYYLKDENGATLAELRQGMVENLQPFSEETILVLGRVLGVEPLIVMAERIARLFEVTIQDLSVKPEPPEENYSFVTIGDGSDLPESLIWQITAGTAPSKIVKGEELLRAQVLDLPTGRSEWCFTHCQDTRFDSAHFDEDTFTGGPCREEGIFDISRFLDRDSREARALFAFPEREPATSADLELKWNRFQPGAFQVILPADLPERFGARFNESYFSQKGDQPEFYPGAVTEPIDDENYLVTLLNSASNLVKAEVVSEVPLGWSPVAMPFRKPRYLSGGDTASAARIYLSEEGIDGFLEIRALKTGAWGNKISVSARPAGPALFGVSVKFEGGKFENARQIALGSPLTVLSKELLQPAPIGVLQAKAAGVHVSVTRETAPAVDH